MAANSLLDAFGLADNPDVILESKDLAQAGAENGLGIGHNNADRAFAVLRMKTVARLNADRSAAHLSSFRALPARPTGDAASRVSTSNYLRSKRYSSMTTPTPRRPPSSKLRTTRPRQSTCTSAFAPTTSAGREIVKSTAEPTGTSASMRNRTPLAEMFSVSTDFPQIPDRCRSTSLPPAV